MIKHTVQDSQVSPFILISRTTTAIKITFYHLLTMSLL
jgi:hypothetical protein